jgi:molybdopterin/thiamine biosynthesis adenylyltransferase
MNDQSKNFKNAFIDFEKDRYGSLKLIDWFDLRRVQRANFLVIGAGAIGNEVLKNLALLGVGNIFIYDRDTIEMSNLTRSILFRAADCNRLKAEAAAEALKQINPDINVFWQSGDIRFDLGLGLIRRMDVIIGCLDNRAARLKINADCVRAGRPWVDAGIGQLNGQIRVFSADEGACYECSFTDDDYIEVGMPCNRLASLYAAEGKIPTTPTIASIVAGVQVQESLKLLDYEHWRGRTLVSHELIFNGTVGDVSRVELVKRDDCPAHETIPAENLVEMPNLSTQSSSVEELVDAVEAALGIFASIELNFEFALSVDCAYCQTKTEILKPVGKFFQEHLVCENCGNDRNLITTHIINRSQTEIFDRLKNLKLSELNIPALDILQAWGADGRGLCFELTGDLKQFFAVSEEKNVSILAAESSSNGAKKDKKQTKNSRVKK